MKKRRLAQLGGIAAIAIGVASCFASQQGLAGDQQALTIPGFWKGFWHGLIAPVAFIVSLFNDHIRVYAAPNAGRWYDFGFMLGIGGFSHGVWRGGSSYKRVPRRSRPSDGAET